MKCMNFFKLKFESWINDPEIVEYHSKYNLTYYKVKKFDSRYTYKVDTDLVLKHYPEAYPLSDNESFIPSDHKLNNFDKIENFKLDSIHTSKNSLIWVLKDVYPIATFQSYNYAFLISQRTKDCIINDEIINDFILKPINLKRQKDNFRYYYLRPRIDINELKSFKNMTIVKQTGQKKQAIQFDSEDDVEEVYSLLESKDFILEKNYLNYSDFVSSYIFPGIYISNNVKKTFQDNGITGVEFLELEQLNFTFNQTKEPYLL